MAKVNFHKVVAALPAQLEPNAIYYVRAGAGMDVYVTNNSGQIVAYPANKPSTNLGVGGRTPADMAITSSTGNSAVLPAANATQAGLMTAAQFNKLADLKPESLAMFELPFLSSATFTAPVTGWYLIAACGAGSVGFSSLTDAVRRGGAGGGLSFKRVWLVAGQTLEIIIGASGSSNGAAGGDTTVTGPGVDLLCRGGSASASGVTTLGGVASGGDYNFDGGDALAQGGGAVSLFGAKATATGRNGADVFPAGTSYLPTGFTNTGGGVFESMFQLLGRIGAGSTTPGVGGVGSGNLSTPGGVFAGGSAPQNSTSTNAGAAGGLGAGAGAGYAYGVLARGGQGFAVVKWGI